MNAIVNSPAQQLEKPSVLVFMRNYKQEEEHETTLHKNAKKKMYENEI